MWSFHCKQFSVGEWRLNNSVWILANPLIMASAQILTILRNIRKQAIIRIWQNMQNINGNWLLKIRHPKVGIDIFSDFFITKTLRAFRIQTQQGHFHPWPFWLKKSKRIFPFSLSCLWESNFTLEPVLYTIVYPTPPPFPPVFPVLYIRRQRMNCTSSNLKFSKVFFSTLRSLSHIWQETFCTWYSTTKRIDIHKSKGRLCKMCNPFFSEFRVNPSTNVFQSVNFNRLRSPGIDSASLGSQCPNL